MIMSSSPVIEQERLNAMIYRILLEDAEKKRKWENIVYAKTAIEAIEKLR